ncbi:MULTISPECIES: MFS transporter [unclassified Microbacterium]|uniref:MFS transporter n=1 Tax=unclassified Microbacterium TaxID=2609290 RepID=UPI000C2BC838|nr:MULTISPECIES: MFS transporter [unclassified Microbacterium]
MSGAVPTPPVAAEPTSIWHPRLVWVTLGAVALIFLAATQSLAMTTVMPIISDDLSGDSLYALAFAGTLATGVIGMVVTGAWSDRSGPKPALYASIALFLIGLIVAGVAPNMQTLVVGRLLQGLGTGGQTVALYVVVARIYPPAIHGRVFAAFAAAWVVPSLVGPLLAGAVTEHLHWRWVFFGVAILTVLAFTAVALRLHALDLRTLQPTRIGFLRRLGLALLVAASVLLLGMSGGFGVASPFVAIAAAVAIGFAARPLLPPRTLRAGRGLPSVILLRGLIAGALFGAEIYVPYLMIDRYGFSPTWAGLGLTTAALAWAISADIQGRFGDRIGNRRIVLIGSALLTVATVTAAVCAVTFAHPAILIAGWTLSGAGVGLVYSRLTVLTLAYSSPGNQGFNSSALSISDSTGAAVTIAVMGLVFTGLSGTGWEFPAVFALAAGIAVFALVPGLRLDARDTTGEDSLPVGSPVR